MWACRQIHRIMYIGLENWNCWCCLDIKMYFVVLLVISQMNCHSPPEPLDYLKLQQFLIRVPLLCQKQSDIFYSAALSLQNMKVAKSVSSFWLSMRVVSMASKDTHCSGPVRVLGVQGRSSSNLLALSWLESARYSCSAAERASSEPVFVLTVLALLLGYLILPDLLR